MSVTVIIPTYNRAHTLLRALRSVFAQEGLDFEVLVVDDGSTDNTRVLLNEEISNRRNLRCFFQENGGPSRARNLGISATWRKFVAFLDSDDEWLPGKLKAQLEFFERNPDYLICQTEEIWIRRGTRVNPMKKHKKFGGFIFDKCLPLSIVSPSCVMVRREFFDRVGLFDETLPACEDYDLWLRTSARFPIGLIEKPYVIKYGGHADQRSRQFSVMDRYRIRALRKLIDLDGLGEVQRTAAISELIRKCEIVRRGAMKRGKMEEAEDYAKLIEEVGARHASPLQRHPEPRLAGRRIPDRDSSAAENGLRMTRLEDST